MRTRLFWIVLAVLGLLCVASCGEDGDDFGDLSANPDCSSLGSIPLMDMVGQGYFTFGGSSRFPLEVEVEADARSFHGRTIVSDSSETYDGTCSGTYTATGAATGSCTLTNGSNTLRISLTGRLGSKGACGDWQNQFSQSGEWVVEATGTGTPGDDDDNTDPVIDGDEEPYPVDGDDD